MIAIASVVPLSVNIGASVGLLGDPAAGEQRDDEQHEADRASPRARVPGRIQRR